MLPYESVEEVLHARPSQLLNVSDAHWERLITARSNPDYARDFSSSWANGRAFLLATDGLRDRTPLTIEWKGPQHPPGYDFLPADLRVDHVFLVSCKYLSKVLANPSPAHLFKRALADRGHRSELDWYLVVAEAEYRVFYSRVRSELANLVTLPADIELLTVEDRRAIGTLCARVWPGSLAVDYEEFSDAVSRNSAIAWSESVPTLSDRELLLWRMIRLNPAPYFILGSSGSTHLRLRVGTPWDWRQRYLLREFDIERQSSGQPRVAWSAKVLDRYLASEVDLRGHVEVRWSHGRFCGRPEAKLYLDTDHSAVPGYVELT